MRILEIANGIITQIDDEDYDILNQYKWYCNNGYVVRSITNVGKTPRQIKISMHRFIMQAPKNVLIDHIDRNTLNNCKNNLRVATHSINGLNRKDNSLRVYWHSTANKWITNLPGGKHIGYFNTKEEAEQASVSARMLSGITLPS